MPSHFRLFFVFPLEYPDPQCKWGGIAQGKCNEVIEHQLSLEKDPT